MGKGRRTWRDPPSTILNLPSPVGTVCRPFLQYTSGLKASFHSTVFFRDGMSCRLSYVGLPDTRILSVAMSPSGTITGVSTTFDEFIIVVLFLLHIIKVSIVFLSPQLLERWDWLEQQSCHHNLEPLLGSPEKEVPLKCFYMIDIFPSEALLPSCRTFHSHCSSTFVHHCSLHLKDGIFHYLNPKRNYFWNPNLHITRRRTDDSQ